MIALYTALSQPFSSYEYYEDHHGYQVYRLVELYRNELDLPKGWNGIQRFVKVRRWGMRKGKRFEETSYYILSKPMNLASHAAQAIQDHWSIENKLHWAKDMNMGEDDTSLHDPSYAAILGYLNNTAINVLAFAGYKPLKDTFAKFANKVDVLMTLFSKK